MGEVIWTTERNGRFKTKTKTKIWRDSSTYGTIVRDPKITSSRRGEREWDWKSIWINMAKASPIKVKHTKLHIPEAEWTSKR